MPGGPSDPGDAFFPIASDAHEPLVYPVRHGVKSPVFRVYVSWARGNALQVACLRSPEPADHQDEPGGGTGGKVVEVILGGGGDGEIDEAQWRRIAYDSVPAFALLQSQRNSLATASRMSAPLRTEWWQHVLEYSRSITDLFGTQELPSNSVIEDPMIVRQPLEEPTSLKAAWQLMEIFYIDRQSTCWLPECLVDWLAAYDCLLSSRDDTFYSKLLCLQKKLVNLQQTLFGLSRMIPGSGKDCQLRLQLGGLTLWWKLLRLHGSYQPDQLDNRETENGLVEAVAVLVSTMPPIPPDLPSGRLGQCYKTKPDFIKAWEKWRGDHIAKLECSAYWVQCITNSIRDYMFMRRKDV